jgi:hypothetical protein
LVRIAVDRHTMFHGEAELHFQVCMWCENLKIKPNQSHSKIQPCSNRVVTAIEKAFNNVDHPVNYRRFNELQKVNSLDL